VGKVNPDAPFMPLRCTVLTISDTRTEETDSSGTVLVSALQEAGHTLVEKKIVRDDIYTLRAVVSAWIADSQVDVILCTGGTGFTPRDNTPQALAPLFDREIQGFGELFRQLSLQEIGTSTLQSRSLAGMANHTLIFCLPGSPNACRTAWNGILKAQLDIRQRPCNFAQTLAIYKPQYGGAPGCESRG
jgi:molybdopterin adenylyltransferase